MSKIDTDYSAIANDPAVNLGVPGAYCDIRVILLALRDEIPRQHIYMVPSITRYKYNVVVPTLRNFVTIKYKKNQVHVIARSHRYKFDCELENFMLPEWAIDVIVELFELHSWHKPKFKFESSSIHADIFRSPILEPVSLSQ